MVCGSTGVCVCGDFWVDANNNLSDGCEAYDPNYKLKNDMCDAPTTPTPTQKTNPPKIPELCATCEKQSDCGDS